MIEYFTAVADPSTVCYDFGICEYPGEDDWHVTDDEEDEGSESEYQESDDYEETDWKKRAVESHLHPADTCNYCSMLLDSMRYYLENDSTANQIKSLFGAYVCGISDNIESVCTNIFSEFEMVLEFLAASESSQNICYKLTLCSEQDKLYNYMQKQILQ